MDAGVLKVIKKDNGFTFTNPGVLKLPKEEIYKGGNSKARNPKMQTMLRMIGFGDNAGSGFPLILNTWKANGWITPELEENFALNQVTLSLVFDKSSEESKRSKTIAHETEILELLTRYGEMKLSDIALEINLSEQRVRAIISKMNEVIPIGNTTSRKYKLKE